MSDMPARTLRPVGLTLTGAPREQRDRLADAGREEGLALLLVPLGSLVFAALLIIALSLITASPSPAPESSGSDPRAWTGSPVIEEQPGDETTRGLK